MTPPKAIDRSKSSSNTPLALRDADAVIVGAGPNGLAAALTLADAGLEVLLIEAEPEVGGGAKSAELTLPGFLHDRCSAVYPLAVGSPFLGPTLERLELEWVHPELPLAHPLSRGAVALLPSLDDTAASLGPDAEIYRATLGPLSRRWHELAPALLGPLPRLSPVLGHTFTLAQLAWRGFRSARWLCDGFRTEGARALLAGLAAHSQLSLEQAPSAAVALLLGAAAHAVGWPFPRGGAKRLSQTLSAALIERGARVVSGHRVDDIEALPKHRVALLDLTPRELLRVAGNKFPDRYRRRLAAFRYGPGACKLDWALSGPIPWRDEICGRAGTVHLGGSFDEIALSEQAVWNGEHARRPFVILAQPSLFDLTRTPAGAHLAWAYCHVPHGSNQSMAQAIEAQVERFAPGFRQRIVGRHETTARQLEQLNPNYVGGDINGGLQDVRQTLARPSFGPRPYATPVPGLFICSSSTPPGGGVHGMCGFHAARLALEALRHSPAPRAGRSPRR